MKKNAKNAQKRAEKAQDVANVAAQIVETPVEKAQDVAEKAAELEAAEKVLAEKQNAFDEAKKELIEAKNAMRKLKGEKTKEKKGPGVIATIFSLVEKSGKVGVSKEEILNNLIEQFPERAPDGMEKTINVQLPGRMSKEKGVKITKTEKNTFVLES